MKAVAVKKKAGLSDIGKQLANGKDNFAMAFDQIKNIVMMIAGMEKWKGNMNVLHYRKLVYGVVKQKDPEKRKDFIMLQVKPWMSLYNAFRDEILSEDLSFLSDEEEEPIKLMTGSSKKAVLPLGEAYMHLLATDVNAVDDMEAKLFILFKNLTGEGSADRKTLDDICEQFVLEEDTGANDAIASIVSRVQKSMGDNNLKGNNAPSMDNVMPVVQSIFQDGALQNNMGNLANAVMNGQMSIPELIGTVQKNVQGQNARDIDETESE